MVGVSDPYQSPCSAVSTSDRRAESFDEESMKMRRISSHRKHEGTVAQELRPVFIEEHHIEDGIMAI
jgi:hypothetical protein